MGESLQLRAAGFGDLEPICSLLAAEGLPTEGVAESIEHFLVFDNGDGVVAAAGIEVHGASALLRSVVVAPELRGRGLAGRLVDRMAENARALGVSAMYLLTIDADGFFANHDFERLPRKHAPGEILGCREFRELCPDTAVLMQRNV